MESLELHNTTAEQAIKLEDGLANPFRVGQQHSAKYFELLRVRRELPVASRRQDFLNMFHAQQVIVLSGDAASGKTTQIPQYILFDEWASGKMIACTQVRSLDAVSAAYRVAEEMDVELSKASGKTRLQYMTDDVLLREVQRDPDFSRYSCVVVDDADQRRKKTDILMALLKRALPLRPDLKVVIMSTPLEAEGFQRYFGRAQTFRVQGQVFPVRIHYLEQPTSALRSLVLHTVRHIHQTMDRGDILVFIPDEDEVEEACLKLRELRRDLEVLSLDSRLSREQQGRVFLPSTSRKCVVTANIAEASLSIDGIVYVVDTGLGARFGYNPRVGMKSTDCAPISKAAAAQRAALAGRTRPGICFRLYDKRTFELCSPPNPVPGILMSDITEDVLLLKNMGWNDLSQFNFINPPHPEVLFRALRNLRAMNYIDAQGSVTSTGRMALELPIEPVWYNAIVMGHKLGCRDEIVTLAALSTAQNSIFLRPKSGRRAAFMSRERLNPLSDHIVAHDMVYEYVQIRRQAAIDIDQWCSGAFLSRHGLEEVMQVRSQLLDLVQELLGEQTVGSSHLNYHLGLREALALSFYHQVAFHSKDEQSKDVYVTVNDNCVAVVDPDSTLAGVNHPWVTYQALTSVGPKHVYLQGVTAIEPEWIVDLEYFQDHKLAKKAGTGGLVQPEVKEALDRVRAKRDAEASVGPLR